MKFLFLESYYGGSHKHFADGFIKHSRHNIDLLFMPEKNWNWRMLGSAYYFYDKIKETVSSYDGLIVTDLIHLADLKSLLGNLCPPIFFYFHENQLGYPDGSNKKKRNSHEFTDISSALSADTIVFNSETHRKSFLYSVENKINRMPDHIPDWIPKRIEKRSSVLYPGCSFTGNDTPLVKKDRVSPTIIWNHRWSYDKNPDHFFIIIHELIKADVNFKLAILGDNFGRIPQVFKTAKDIYKDRIIHFGYARSRSEYINLLKQGNLVISTANQENFGFSVIEALYHGCLPLLPNRLSYPEILPKAYHETYLYKNIKDAVQKAAVILENPHDYEADRQAISNNMKRYAWNNVIDDYDDLLEKIMQ